MLRLDSDKVFSDLTAKILPWLMILMLLIFIIVTLFFSITNKEPIPKEATFALVGISSIFIGLWLLGLLVCYCKGIFPCGAATQADGLPTTNPPGTRGTFRCLNTKRNSSPPVSPSKPPSLPPNDDFRRHQDEQKRRGEEERRRQREIERQMEQEAERQRQRQLEREQEQERRETQREQDRRQEQQQQDERVRQQQQQQREHDQRIQQHDRSQHQQQEQQQNERRRQQGQQQQDRRLEPPHQQQYRNRQQQQQQQRQSNQPHSQRKQQVSRIPIHGGRQQREQRSRPQNPPAPKFPAGPRPEPLRRSQSQRRGRSPVSNRRDINDQHVSSRPNSSLQSTPTSKKFKRRSSSNPSRRTSPHGSVTHGTSEQGSLSMRRQRRRSDLQRRNHSTPPPSRDGQLEVETMVEDAQWRELSSPDTQARIEAMVSYPGVAVLPQLRIVKDVGLIMNQPAPLKISRPGGPDPNSGRLVPPGSSAMTQRNRLTEPRQRTGEGQRRDPGPSLHRYDDSPDLSDPGPAIRQPHAYQPADRNPQSHAEVRPPESGNPISQTPGPARKFSHMEIPQRPVRERRLTPFFRTDEVAGTMNAREPSLQKPRSFKELVRHHSPLSLPKKPH